MTETPRLLQLRPKPTLVSYRRLCYLRRINDQAAGHEELLSLVPSCGRIERDPHGSGQHASCEVFRVVSGNLLWLSERVVLGEISVLIFLGRNCDADR